MSYCEYEAAYDRRKERIRKARDLAYSRGELFDEPEPTAEEWEEIDAENEARRLAREAEEAEEAEYTDEEDE